MALRIHTRWRQPEGTDGEARSLSDVGGALAAIAWRIALDRAKNLHGVRFDYRSDGQRIAVICEYLGYVVHLVDRLVHDDLPDAERRTLVTSLAGRLSEHVDENVRELFGPGEWAADFLRTLDLRSGTYAEYGFREGEASYPMRRQLGFLIQELMGHEEENRWVIDQVMDVDAPFLERQIRQAVENLT